MPDTKWTPMAPRTTLEDAMAQIVFFELMPEYKGRRTAEDHGETTGYIDCPLCRAEDVELVAMNDGSLKARCLGQCATKKLGAWFKEHHGGLGRRVPARPRQDKDSPPPAATQWDMNPHGGAWRMILGHAHELMAATQDGEVARGMTLTGVGTWLPAEADEFHRWYGDNCELWRALAVQAQQAGELMAQDATRIIAYLGKTTTRAQANEVSRLLEVVARRMDDQKQPTVGMTRVKGSQLDADTRYLVCGNGVVDLDTGALLTPQAAKEKLVTHRTGVDFQPDAQHWAIDKLFSHLDRDRAAYLQACLGRALWGRPDKLFLMIVGSRDSGKTTLLAAIRAALGDAGYSANISEDVFRAGDRNRTGPTEERRPLVEARLAVAEEVSGWKVATDVLKAFSGGAASWITFQPKYGREYTRRVTATILLTANNMPTLGLVDPALAARFKVVRYTRPAAPDPALRDAVLEPQAAEAMLALLVRLAVENPPGKDLDPPPVVVADSEQEIHDMMSPFQRWLQAAVHVGRPAHVSSGLMWRWWAAHNERSQDADEIGGQKKANVGKAFKSLFQPSPATRIWDPDTEKAVRGWWGYSLRDGCDLPTFLDTAQDCACGRALLASGAALCELCAAESFKDIVGVAGSARHMCPHGPGCAECESAAVEAQAMEAYRYQLSMLLEEDMNQGNGPPCPECGTLLIVNERQPDRGRCPRCMLEEATWAAEGAAEFPALIAKYGHHELEHTPEHGTASCRSCDPKASIWDTGEPGARECTGKPDWAPGDGFLESPGVVDVAEVELHGWPVCRWKDHECEGSDNARR